MSTWPRGPSGRPKRASAGFGLTPAVHTMVLESTSRPFFSTTWPSTQESMEVER